LLPDWKNIWIKKYRQLELEEDGGWQQKTDLDVNNWSVAYVLPTVTANKWSAPMHCWHKSSQRRLQNVRDNKRYSRARWEGKSGWVLLAVQVPAAQIRST